MANRTDAAASAGILSGIGTVVTAFADKTALSPAEFTAALHSGAAVAAAAVVAYLAHELGSKKIGAKTVAADIAADFPAVKATAEAAEPLLAKVPGLESGLEAIKHDVASALDAANKATDGVSGVVESEVAKQLGPLTSVLSKLGSPTAAS